ncbi:MAG: prepilin-type N-terminal cleavage/methylation domain-containing protein [Pseudomonadota bacterium]
MTRECFIFSLFITEVPLLKIKSLLSKYSSKSGFTLLELLISLSLVALMLTFLSGSFTFGKRVWERSNAIVETASIPIIQDFLRTRLEQAVPVRVRRDATSLSLSFSGQSKRLSFIAPMNAQTVSAGLYEMALYFENGALKLRLTLFRPHQQSTSIPPPFYDRVLLENIEDVRFEYAWSSLQHQNTKWSSHWQNKEDLPSLIRIKVIFKEEDRRRWPMLIIAPRLDS